MPREFRRVPPDWEHPRVKTQQQADRLNRTRAFGGYTIGDHIPQHARKWPPGVATAYQYYESTTEGTPLSPVCATLDEMAAWLAANHDAFGDIEDARRYIQQGEW